MPVCHFYRPEEDHIVRNVVYVLKGLPQDICGMFGVQLPPMFSYSTAFYRANSTVQDR